MVIRQLTLMVTALFLLMQSQAGIAQNQKGGKDLGQAVRSVEQQTGGQVLSAEKRVVDGQERYRIKVLSPDGRIKIIHVDAR